MSININELRVGNWVNWYEENENVQVLEIDPSGIKVIFKDKEITWIEKEQFNPISINQETLTKICGFKKDGIEYTNCGIVIIFEQQAYKHCYNSGMNDFINIRYLHQLQNLFFALTNEELPINIKALNGG